MEATHSLSSFMLTIRELITEAAYLKTGKSVYENANSSMKYCTFNMKVMIETATIIEFQLKNQ